VISLPGVVLEDSDSFDVALRRFKKQIEKAGVLSELKSGSTNEKPSDAAQEEEGCGTQAAAQKAQER
jgi:small subunit ribosomal protein S21